MKPYLELGIASLLPAAVSGLLFLLDNKTAFERLDWRIKRVIWGTVFGLLAVGGIEWSISLGGASLNCLDAAVITAGLFFGGPAGIIAGVIGAVARWITAAAYTRLAGSLSAVLAGFYAYQLRKYMFENKRPGWIISAAVGVVMEVIHLTMIFLTNMATPDEAAEIIRVCAVPVIIANAFSVMLSAVVLSLLAGRNKRDEDNSQKPAGISRTIQRWLLFTILIAFASTSYFVFGLQNRISEVQSDSQLNMALDEIEADIKDASDKNLITIAEKLTAELDTWQGSLRELADSYGVEEINIVNGEGIVTETTDGRFLGFDMHSGEQSAQFLCLLEGEESFAQDYGPIAYDASISRKYAGVVFRDGFVQVGYDADSFQSDVSREIVGITRNRHVGETGFILIIDEQYDVISAPAGLELPNIRNDVDEDALPDEDVTFKGLLSGVACLFRYRSAEGYYIVSVLPEKEALQMRNVALYVNSFMEILVFAVLFGLIYQLIKNLVVDKIKIFNTSLRSITEGNLDETVDVRGSREFSALSDDINTTVDTLKRYISDASKRLDEELEFARSIQRSALPSVFPAFPRRKDLDIYALMDPAKEVGGDFYDFYMTGGDKLNFLVADVSGKGIPAAMFMMRAKTELKSLTEAELNLSEVFTRCNGRLCEGNDAGMFLTAWQGCIDLSTGQVIFANAGHNPPLVRRAGGRFEFLPGRGGFVLAGMDGISYKTRELQLNPGDILYLYTDGVTEAMNASGELFGDTRLAEALNRVEFDDMNGLCAGVKSAVDAFVGDAPQFDDITMLALRYEGQPPVPSICFEEASIEDIPAATEFLERELESAGVMGKAVMQLCVALDEIFSNIVRHGYPDRPGPVTLEILQGESPRSVSMRFTDEGIPYNPMTADEPDISLTAEMRDIGGLGIYMVKKTMDAMQYKYENDRNIFTVQKNY